MICEPIIDYISISVPIPLLLSNYAIHINEGTPFEVDRRTKRLVNLITSDHTAIETRNSGRFNRLIRSEKFGYTYMDGQNSPVSLVQISGSGCEYLRTKGWMKNVIQDWNDRVTRLDIAVDIKSDTRPEIFARTRPEGRFTDDSHRNSASGSTWYVGNTKSDRHARVYRYELGHPRHDFLRVEYELHDERAKQCASLILERGVPSVASSLGDVFGWQHEDYRSPTEVEKLPSLARPENPSRTEKWIHHTVKPAIEKMAAGGKLEFLIDFYHWLGALLSEYSVTERTPYDGIAS